MTIALPPVCTVTNLAGHVTESKSRDHRKRGGQHSYPFGRPPISNCQLRMRDDKGSHMPRADADDPWEYIFPSRCENDALAWLRRAAAARDSVGCARVPWPVLL
jgi:hypothetical protein